MTTTLDLASAGFPGLGDLGSLVRIVEAAELMTNAGTCSHPIRLTGGHDVVEAATGLLLKSVTGQEITVSCGNRRASVCAYCSTLYKYDAYNLVAAGLRGGGAGNIPASVAAHPVLFVTLTAPSFGPVHLGPDKKGDRRACHVRRTGPTCSRWHAPGEPLIGTPIDPDTYDYQGHALFNALAGKLWSATTTEIRRTLARLAGLTRAEFARLATVTFAKVAEYQARGIVHFHAVIRLDGPDGPASTPPDWASTELLADAIRDAIARTSVAAPSSNTAGSRSFAWGRQCDVRPIARGEPSDTTDTLTDIKVARYIAKYATKSAEAAGVELPPIACRTCAGSGRTAENTPDRPPVLVPCSGCGGHGRSLDLDHSGLTDHARRLIEACWTLGAVPELAELRLRKWAHMLGFRGHFATKSRTYSTSFSALRQERADFKAQFDPVQNEYADSPDILVVNNWAYAGRADSAAPATRSSRLPVSRLEGVSP
jgi:hypothetical protein